MWGEGSGSDDEVTFWLGGLSKIRESDGGGAEEERLGGAVFQSFQSLLFFVSFL